jgi:uncharacterized protein
MFPPSNATVFSQEVDMLWIAAIIGVCSGLLGGMIGIGGGIIIIPALTMFLGYGQHRAQGTTLAAMIPPIGFFAAYEYYRKGQVDIPVALCVAAGFLAGGFFGAKLAALIDAGTLKKIFGLILLLVSLKLILRG